MRNAAQLNPPHHRLTAAPSPAPRAMPRRSAVVSALLSALIPGAGQVYQGRRRRGLMMAGTTLPVLAGAALLWRADPYQTLAWLVRPEVLVGVLIANLALLGLRLFAVTDAYLAGERRFASAGLLAIVLALTAAPHLAAGYYDLLTLDALVEIFPAGGQDGPPPGAAEPRREVTTTLPVVLLPTPTPGA